MPPPYLLTIRDQILYEHAQLMSRAAFGKPEHGFIYDRFKLLRTGRLRIEDTIREWERESPLPEACISCGSKENLKADFLVPMSRGGADTPENRVLMCAKCNDQRGNRGVYEWLGLLKKDSLHRIIAARYLRQLYAAHEAAGTLGVSKDEIGTLCHSCPLPGVCEEWASEGKMTCFCLESVLPQGPQGTAG